jgi:hypothetical protein
MKVAPELRMVDDIICDCCTDNVCTNATSEMKQMNTQRE